MKAYYFTFPSDSILGYFYVKVEADDWNKARQKMVDAFKGKPKFAFQYEESDFLPQIDKYGLTACGMYWAVDQFKE